LETRVGDGAFFIALICFSSVFFADLLQLKINIKKLIATKQDRIKAMVKIINIVGC
jgi:hypothetical protein